MIWTVDYEKVKAFILNYSPKMPILHVQVNWNSEGGLFYISLKTQKKIFKKLGTEGYIKAPREGTNPRGVEFSKEALNLLVKDSETKKIKIFWHKSNLEFDLYGRWLEQWVND